MSADELVPADRYIEAQSWWIASEVARRNPALRIAETMHDEVGTSLAIYDPENLIARQVLLNRIAGCNIVGDPFSHIGWAEIFSTPSPHDIVKRTEAGLLLAPASPAPPTNEITIIYRVIARVLSTVVNDRHSWMIRGERPEDPSIVTDIGWAGDLGGFPSISALRTRWLELTGFEGQGVTRLWVIWKDLAPIALFDMFGDVHTTDGCTNLLRAYRASGNNLGLTVALTLGRHLP